MTVKRLDNIGIVVEDIDAAIGEANKVRSQDFSKIQGRFHTRLSLASSNTDEVIGVRLLTKTSFIANIGHSLLVASGTVILGLA